MKIIICGQRVAGEINSITGGVEYTVDHLSDEEVQRVVDELMRMESAAKKLNEFLLKKAGGGY